MQLVFEKGNPAGGTPTNLFNNLKGGIAKIYTDESNQAAAIRNQRKPPPHIIPPDVAASITHQFFEEEEDIQWMVLNENIVACLQSALGVVRQISRSGDVVGLDPFLTPDGKVRVILAMALEHETLPDYTYYADVEPGRGLERDESVWRKVAEMHEKIPQAIQECAKKQGVVTEGALGKKVRAHEVRRITRELDDSTPHTVPSDVNRHIAEYAATPKIGTSRKRKTRRATKKRRGKTLKKRK